MKAFCIAAALMLAAPAPVLAQAGDDQAERASDPFVPAPIDADGRAVVAGMNDFGVALYGKLAGESSRDFAVSPASVSTAFALAYAGSAGKTESEIASVLRYPAVGDLHKSLGGLLKSMTLDRSGRTMTVNNAIWLQQGLPVHETYLALVERNYGAGLMRVDYAKDADAARQQINRWVESKTADKIKNLLGPPVVTKETKSILVNTIYFKASWRSLFEVDATKPEPFERTDGSRVALPLMRQQNNFTYAEAGGIKALAMPYEGGETEMVFLLPAKPDGLAALETSLLANGLDPWIERLNGDKGGPVIVTLPRFKIESSFDLKDSLEAMGMATPFTNASDFSRMKPVDIRSGDPNDWNLKIGAVIHKVFVEVEEKGTEAAAATALVGDVIVSASRADPPKPRIFRADRPFLFAIRDRRTGVVLFLGRFTGN